MTHSNCLTWFCRGSLAGTGWQVVQMQIGSGQLFCCDASSHAAVQAALAVSLRTHHRKKKNMRNIKDVSSGLSWGSSCCWQKEDTETWCLHVSQIPHFIS